MTFTNKEMEEKYQEEMEEGKNIDIIVDSNDDYYEKLFNGDYNSNKIIKVNNEYLFKYNSEQKTLNEMYQLTNHNFLSCKYIMDFTDDDIFILFTKFSDYNFWSFYYKKINKNLLKYIIIYKKNKNNSDLFSYIYRFYKSDNDIIEYAIEKCNDCDIKCQNHNYLNDIFNYNKTINQETIKKLLKRKSNMIDSLITYKTIDETFYQEYYNNLNQVDRKIIQNKILSIDFYKNKYIGDNFIFIFDNKDFLNKSKTDKQYKSLLIQIIIEENINIENLINMDCDLFNNEELEIMINIKKEMLDNDKIYIDWFKICKNNELQFSSINFLKKQIDEDKILTSSIEELIKKYDKEIDMYCNNIENVIINKKREAIYRRRIIYEDIYSIKYNINEKKEIIRNIYFGLISKYHNLFKKHNNEIFYYKFYDDLNKEIIYTHQYFDLKKNLKTHSFLYLYIIVKYNRIIKWIKTMNFNSIPYIVNCMILILNIIAMFNLTDEIKYLIKKI